MTLSLSSNVNLHHTINLRALCGANVVTQHPGFQSERNPCTPPCGMVFFSIFLRTLDPESESFGITGEPLWITSTQSRSIQVRSHNAKDMWVLTVCVATTLVGGGVRIHPENTRMSVRHGVQCVAQCIACEALALAVW